MNKKADNKIYIWYINKCKEQKKMTVEELEKEIEILKLRAEMTDFQLESLEAGYAKLERIVTYLKNILRQEL